MEDDEGDTLCPAEPPSNSSGIDGYYFYVTEQLILQWFLLLAIVLGNGSVLLALAYSKNRKSRMNYFIMHLAIADISVGLISVSTDLVWKYTIEWHAGNIACKVVKYLQALVTYSSTYVLVALSIDRFDAIKHPMKFSGSWRRAKFLIGAAWVLSAIFAQPVFFLYEEKCIQGRHQCWIHFPEQWMWQLFMSLVSLTVFFIPAVIISACYAVIVWTIWSKGSSVIVVTKRTAKGAQSSKVKLDHESETRRASSRGLIPRAKVKTVKMTFVIVSVFILCWSPYMIFDLLQVFKFIPESQVSIAVATLIQSLAPLNSAANPLIYCLFSTRICRSLKKFAPISWIINRCCPQHSSRRHRYAGDLSSTMTSSLTQSRTRSHGISLTTTNSVGSNKRHVTLL